MRNLSLTGTPVVGNDPEILGEEASLKLLHPMDFQGGTCLI